MPFKCVKLFPLRADAGTLTRNLHQANAGLDLADILNRLRQKRTMYKWTLLDMRY